MSLYLNLSLSLRIESMLNNINLNLLRSLLVLLEECHVSRAATRLNITQSAVSRQLAQLRKLFADPLLIRDGNNLYKTPKAEKLQAKLEVLLGEFNHLIEAQKFEPENWTGEMSFACSDYVAQYIFPEVVEKISRVAKNARFNYHFWQPNELDHFVNSPIKLAATLAAELPVNTLGRLIGEDCLVCVMSQDHPLSQTTTLSLDDLLCYQHIIITGGGDKDSELDRCLSELERSRDIGLKTPFYSAAFSTLVRSDYLLIIPQHIARNMQKHVPIFYFDLPVTLTLQRYWLIWHPKYDSEPSHQWMREQVFDTLRNSIYSVGYEN